MQLLLIFFFSVNLIYRPLLLGKTAERWRQWRPTSRSSFWRYFAGRQCQAVCHGWRLVKRHCRPTMTGHVSRSLQRVKFCLAP